MAFLIFPDGARHEVLAKQTNARLTAGRKRFEGILEGDDAVLSRALQLNGIRLETDSGQTYLIHVMPEGVNFTYVSA